MKPPKPKAPYVEVRIQRRWSLIILRTHVFRSELSLSRLYGIKQAIRKGRMLADELGIPFVEPKP